jgi:hypothetical protein
MQLLCIDPARNHEFWPHVAPLLKAALARTNLSRFEDIEVDVLSGAGLLWIAWSGQIEAAATTALIQTNTGTICVLTACGGRGMARWLALLEHIEAYARNEGCSALRIFGRKGWQRMLKQYQATNIVLERKL